ncbi:MAG: hypothetical protein QGH99_07765 [Pseudomonadales bacterium]|nr:hypothetical protein [Pseudomonadales bacterium]MDP7314088.1 hypothetical protein [Pseudomonadales bacterium]MDP7576847.1 hypothetical protein [Pseudomonadales bacterium]HJP50173.1 hypothetical protein [Pseudomonadales bacterium]
MMTRTKYRRGLGVLISVLSAMMVLVSSAAAANAPGEKEDPYQALLRQQIQKINLTEEQADKFRARFRDYVEDRNGATRRVSRSGGDLGVRVRRDLKRTARKAVNSISSVLTAEQLEHYEELLKIANEQYMFNAGLL